MQLALSRFVTSVVEINWKEEEYDSCTWEHMYIWEYMNRQNSRYSCNWTNFFQLNSWSNYGHKYWRITLVGVSHCTGIWCRKELGRGEHNTLASSRLMGKWHQNGIFYSWGCKTVTDLEAATTETGTKALASLHWYTYLGCLAQC